MGIRRSWVVLVVLSTPALAGASDHRFDVFVAPFTSGSVVVGSSSYLQGWHVGFAAATPWFNRKLSFVGDISTHFMGKDEETGGDLTQTSILVGPRYTFASGKSHTFMPFAHAIILGVVIEDKVAAGDKPVAHASTGAFAVGAGFDASLSEGKNWGTRFQIDWIKPIFDESVRPSFRFSVGVIYRFPLPSSHHDEEEREPVKEKKGS